MLTRAYYNEIEPFAVNWLRNIIDAGHIAHGDVDSRSISDVTPSDLAGYTQCHFFAGIGGWSLALRLAGWEDSRPVWTGSCPCQPFSNAGTEEGFADERHLWPDWFHLIRVCRPSVIFGEQVENAINHGWLDLVQDDLEGEGYAFAPVGIPAAGVGTPHIRHRLWFVADNALARREARGSNGVRVEPGYGQGLVTRPSVEGSGLADHHHLQPHGNGDAGSGGWTELTIGRWMDNNNNQGSQGREQFRYSPDQRTPWAPGLVDWLPCTDGKWRPVEAGTFPLADGLPGRVGLLRGYGNAIVPQVAAEVIRAYMQCRS